MSSQRRRRQDALRSLVRSKRIRTQAALIECLDELGFAVTQATVSRDIADLGVEKDAQGAYVLPEDHRLRNLVASVVIETRRAANQVLVLCDPGTAGSVAAALDASQMSGVLGSIAGDDTILVICADEARGAQFQQTIDSMLSRN